MSKKLVAALREKKDIPLYSKNYGSVPNAVLATKNGDISYFIITQIT